MKKHEYYFGETKCHSYFKTVGHGYEVGFYFGKQCVFVGNFIHATEAKKWYGVMNTEMRKFTNRYAVGVGASMTWYKKFFSNHLYKAYYNFLDTQFTKYHKTFAKAYRSDEKKYRSFSKKFDHNEEYFYFQKAA